MRICSLRDCFDKMVQITMNVRCFDYLNKIWLFNSLANHLAHL